jgi:hypothetical protein
MKLNVRRNALSNVTSYASYPSTFFVPWDFLFHANHNTNPSMLGTLDSSCSQVSTRQIISISLRIQLIIGPLRHRKSRRFQKRILNVCKYVELAHNRSI